MASSLRILCVHSVGHEELDAGYRSLWVYAITHSLQQADPSAQPLIDFVDYDDLFDKAELNFGTYAAAISELLASYITHGIGGGLGGARGFLDFPQQLRWTAGMIVQWSAEESLRSQANRAVLKAMAAKDYDVVCAHSLGSLIAYDAFARNPDAIRGKYFATFGSQIGHPAVRDVFAGYIRMIPAKHWFHLFNPDDRVFTCPLSIADAAFTQVLTPFDVPNDLLNHNAEWYLTRPETIATLTQTMQGAIPKALASAARAFNRATRAPDKRALLIGINEYPDPANRLEGCVNDVFLMSSLLQECGFQSEDIRVVLDSRATAAAILDRLHWLLDGVEDDDQRVLFYSGHGAQMPVYGARGRPDRVVETLVPWDFDWSLSKAITDRQFCNLYSQLPYDSHFVAIFDCCHSGGMTREGGARVRGITPPDDVRHRALRWNAIEKMWVPRDFGSPNQALADSDKGKSFLGRNGATHRFGRGVDLRTLPKREYEKRRAALGHRGPYLPVIVEACDVDQLSFEYRDGATSYGAFTYSLVHGLRASRDIRSANLDYHDLLAETAAKLKRLNYDQTPQLVGAKAVLNQAIPWQLGAVVAKGATKRAVKPAMQPAVQTTVKRAPRKKVATKKRS